MPRESDSVTFVWETDAEPANEAGDRPSGVVRRRGGYSPGAHPDEHSTPVRTMQSGRWNKCGHARLGGVHDFDDD